VRENARTFATDAAHAGLLGLLADDELVHADGCYSCALPNKTQNSQSVPGRHAKGRRSPATRPPALRNT